MWETDLVLGWLLVGLIISMVSAPFALRAALDKRTTQPGKARREEETGRKQKAPDDFVHWTAAGFERTAKENNRPTADSRQPDQAPKRRATLQERIWELEARIERLQASGRTSVQQREDWRRRALAAETKLAEVAVKRSNGTDQNTSDNRYPALKRYLAKQFHPDHAPGHGIERIARIEIFKEIWCEINRLDHQPKQSYAGDQT